MSDLPRVFVASSSEQIQVAQRIAELLADPGEWTVHAWDRLFDFSASYVESLERELDRADFAVVVLTGDDTARVRRKTTVLPRDNVIFELGLFIGRLGRPRCYFFVDADTGTQIASDLSGVKAASFYPDVAPPDPRRPNLADQVDRVKVQIREFGLSAVRYKPTLDQRNRQAALWRFSSRVSGQWWERVKRGEDQQSALSYVTISVDPITNEPYIKGFGYNLQSELLTDWWTVITGVLFGDKPKIYYAWQGEHRDAVGQRYGGHAVITFDSDALETAEGYFFDTNFAHIAEGAPTVIKRLRLYRCSAEDIEVMRTPYSDAARAVIAARLNSLRA